MMQYENHSSTLYHRMNQFSYLQRNGIAVYSGILEKLLWASKKIKKLYLIYFKKLIIVFS